MTSYYFTFKRNLTSLVSKALFSTKISLALIPLLFLFLFYSPAAPAYAQVLNPRQVAEYALT